MSSFDAKPHSTSSLIDALPELQVVKWRPSRDRNIGGDMQGVIIESLLLDCFRCLL